MRFVTLYCNIRPHFSSLDKKQPATDNFRNKTTKTSGTDKEGEQELLKGDKHYS